MISLKSKEGTTDIHIEGTRADIIADTITICVIMVQIAAEHMSIKPAKALIYITQRALEYFSTRGDTE